VLTGTIGFYACFWFVRKIYASVKIDWLLFRET
jgi:transmembrane 9 superfamily protein 2/4